MDISGFGHLSFYSDFTGVVLGTLMLSTISQIVLNRITPYLLILFFGMWIDYPAFYFFGPVYLVLAFDLILRIATAFSFFYLSSQAFRQRNYTIAIVALNSGIINVFSILIIYESFNLNTYYILSVFIINFILITFYLSTNFARKSKNLEVQLVEIKNLSEDNLKKELEKQLILSTQNETLERQVTERTAELSTKNRELEVEAALERVRSRTIAMQKSNEVLSVAATLYEELQKLGFTYGITGINLIDEETSNMETWAAGFGQDNYPKSYNIPYFDHPLQKSIIEAWRSGTSYLVYHLAGAEKKAYDDFMFTQSDYKTMPEDVKAQMIAAESAIFSIAFMRYGNLLWAPTPLTKEKAQVLKRFAKVFEQTYTRFLDLQKAEAQAREAQIEAALERVRAKTASMQSSDELSILIGLIYTEMAKLNVQLQRCFFMCLY